MWILLLLIHGYLIHADVPNRTTVYIRISDKPINFTSPHFPADMCPPNLNTLYNITVFPGYTLKLTIVSLDLEPVCCDYLQIVEFNRPIYTFRGTLPSLSPFYFTSRHLLFIFRTDAQGNFPGFQLILERTLWAPCTRWVVVAINAWLPLTTKVFTLHILPITTLVTLYVHGQLPHDIIIAYTLRL